MIGSGRRVGGLWIWVYDPNNKDIANAMSTAYRIFSANDLQNYPGLNDFARMIFYGLKYMGNQDDENSSEYKIYR